MSSPHDSDFQTYERLSLGLSRSASFRETTAAKEELAWKLHKDGGPAGEILLAFELLGKGYSTERKLPKVRSFARDLLFRAHVELLAKEDKSDWEWYWLGQATQFVGRFTDDAMRESAAAFYQARSSGNAYAEFEEIWLSYLLGESAYKCVNRFSQNAGPLAEFSAKAARALTVLALGPVRHSACEGRVVRILELWRMQWDFYRHTQGTRRLRQDSTLALAREAEENTWEDSPLGWLIRYLIPAPGRRDQSMLLRALDPENSAMLWVIQGLQLEDLQLLQRECAARNWGKSEIAQAIRERLQ